jgi:hypothetical protein
VDELVPAKASVASLTELATRLGTLRMRMRDLLHDTTG